MTPIGEITDTTTMSEPAQETTAAKERATKADKGLKVKVFKLHMELVKAKEALGEAQHEVELL